MPTISLLVLPIEQKVTAERFSLPKTSAYNACMVYEEFQASIVEPQPPPDITALLTALWWDAKGDWNQAHEIAQNVASSGAAWVHAYLHRKERDENNAGYWYRRAGKPHARNSFEAEWEEIVRAFLDNSLTIT